MQRHKTYAVAAALLGGSLLFGGTAALAAMEGADSIMVRKAVMTSLGAHNAAIKAGIAAGDAKTVAAQAKAINRLAGVLIGMFPEGSGPEAGDTAALPAVWDKWDDFMKRPKVLAAESEKLAKIAEAGDASAMGDQFGKMGKEGCGGCHETFRKKKE